MTPSSSSSSSIHLLFFPFPSYGHIIPLLDLTNRLLARGFTITVLITPPNLHLLDPLLTFPTFDTLVLTPPALTSRGFFLTGKVRSFSELSGPITAWFRSHPSPPHAIVSDFFLGWTQTLASDLGIPRLAFCPSGAFGTAEFYALWRDRPENPNPDHPDFEVRFDRIPNSPSLPWWNVSHVYRRLDGLGDETAADWEFFRECVVANLSSWGTIINSFAELEGVYVDYLKKEMGNDRVWPVGPLLPPEKNLTSPRGGANSLPSDEVLAWLNRRADSSVVFVCFGSRVSLWAEQTEALGAALESSGVNFVWACRESDGSIPKGLEEGVGERGLVIRGWAPQLVILQHRATAAFLTHCGWNSVLESVAAGVMMVMWPMGADQFVNAKLVEEVGAGMRVMCSGPENVPDAAELGRMLRESVKGDRPERVRVRELRAAAVKEGGDSRKSLDRMVRELRESVKGDRPERVRVRELRAAELKEGGEGRRQFD